MAKKKAEPKDETPDVPAALVEPEPEASPEPEPEADAVDEPAPIFEIRAAPTGPGDTIIVSHAGQEHEAVVVGFTMAVQARLKDGKDTDVLIAHGGWRPKK